jgi:hypothetical protein
VAQVLKEQLPHSLTVKVQLFLEWNLSWLELGTDYLWLSADLFQVRKKAVEYAGPYTVTITDLSCSPLMLYQIWLNFKIQNQELHIRETFLELYHLFIFGLSSCSHYIYK